MMTAEEVRAFALSLPEAQEQEHWGKPSFRVGKKIFAVIQEDGLTLTVKTTAEDRMAYTTMDPLTFSIPASFSNLNYMVVQMNRIDPNELRDLLMLGWRLVAPKRLVKLMS
ncbi:MmcQ/YjbR family DNA-binding protein [Paenibacillus mendelii]|uniref:MmcQ/YjbR family DNA-binding protein n=1 Tax=Paenibacillus mendelii TaxID=206163 RepID=A0ABV6JEH6_9BACL|nr:MmcQ/YjbR family DNA-binding protein [Paenibacillus mendelii]MCQ6557180.1 MmcQ/YjbR family DNA-binding protein [Paenibacillus mendelii]